MATTYFDGVPVRDKHLAALLTAAEQQGWRFEEARNGGHQKQSGLVGYPPNPDDTTVRFGVARVTPQHVLNVRSELRARGFTDTATTDPKDDDMARNSKTKPQHEHRGVAALDYVADPALDVDERGSRVGELVKSLGDAAGMDVEDAGLMGLLAQTITTWAIDPSVRSARETLRGSSAAAEAEAAVNDALRIAAEAEERAVAAEAALAKAEAREQQARKDCGEALSRAKAAEARAESLDAALRPLRALLAAAE